MTERFDHFLDLLAYLTIIIMGLRTAALLIVSWRYADSPQRVLDVMHGRTRTFPWPSSLLWVLIAAAWLYA